MILRSFTVLPALLLVHGADAAAAAMVLYRVWYIGMGLCCTLAFRIIVHTNVTNDIILLY